MSATEPSPIVELSSRKFLAGSLIAGLILGFLGLRNPWPAWFIAAEVFLTIISLFLFGSMKYRIHKDALTFGMGFVIFATFFGGWWQRTPLNRGAAPGSEAGWGEFIFHHFLTLHGLDQMIHADTLLFILGLTYFVCVIAQTRLLESVSFAILRKNAGRIVPTVGILTALVSAASGILDGVSMIGLMIRTLVIILLLARAPKQAMIYVTIVATVITTVCGMWLAYGEPPNLIMKSNLHPHLDNAFFLRYCLPVAIGSYLLVFWNIRRHLAGLQVPPAELAALQARAAQEDTPGLRAARRMSLVAFIPFIAGLIWHGIDHKVPLFLASFAGFAVAFLGIARLPQVRQTALRDAKHEFAEYYFLIPLFFSVTLLQKTGFFDTIAQLLQWGIAQTGVATVALAQFYGATFLSALLDNNIVADFAAHALHGLELGVLHLFAMAQIAGYAAGGCWTHIGSAQSVVAYAYIQNNVDAHYTPFQWIKAITPLILQILVFVTVVLLVMPHILKN